MTFNPLNMKCLCIQAAQYDGEYWFAEQCGNYVDLVYQGNNYRMPKWLTIA